MPNDLEKPAAGTPPRPSKPQSHPARAPRKVRPTPVDAVHFDDVPSSHWKDGICSPVSIFGAVLEHGLQSLIEDEDRRAEDRALAVLSAAAAALDAP